MSKSRVARVSHKSLYLILGLSLTAFFVYAIFRPDYGPQPVQIDAISSLSYGPVEVEGLLQKDSVLWGFGKFILVTPSTNLVVLDIQGIDILVGSKVLVKGIMAPPSVDSGDKNIIQVNSIEVVQ